jgi:transposase-like protein
MIKKMASPKGMSATKLSEEVGICQSTLSRWLREAGNVSRMSELDQKDKIPASRKRPQDWSAEEKFKAVIESYHLDDEQLGAFLRERGLHESHLQQWRKEMESGAKEELSPRKRKAKRREQQRRIRQLERELRRKEKALAEAAALLVLKKKVQQIWGDEDEDTIESSDK